MIHMRIISAANAFDIVTGFNEHIYIFVDCLTYCVDSVTGIQDIQYFSYCNEVILVRVVDQDLLDEHRS